MFLNEFVFKPLIFVLQSANDNVAMAKAKWFSISAGKHRLPPSCRCEKSLLKVPIGGRRVLSPLRHPCLLKNSKMLISEE